jgi:SAM-dependent methyltransferase
MPEIHHIPDLAAHDLAKRYGWEAELIHLLLALPENVIDRFVTESHSYDMDGWRYILPELSTASCVLCLDARFGTTSAALAETGANVTALHTDPAYIKIMQYRIEELNATHIDIQCIEKDFAALPFPDASFDAFVFHDVASTWIHDDQTPQSTIRYLKKLFKEASRVLRPDGFAYFGLGNNFGFTTLLHKLSRAPVNGVARQKTISASHAKLLIRNAGFRDMRAYPFLIEANHVHEIIPVSGYRSTKNSFSFNERLKRMILGRRGARYFAPAYGFVCTRNRLPHSTIQNIATDLSTRKILAGNPGELSGFSRYLVLQAKTVVSLGPSMAGRGNLIAIIPRSQKIIDWRRREIPIVSELRARSPFLSAKLPQTYLESSYKKETFFILSEIPGITIDRKVPHLHALTRNATDFLIHFNLETQMETVITPDIYDRMFGDLFMRVGQNYPETREIVSRIEAKSRTLVAGRSLPVVWMHGDYKLENLMFNSSNLEIEGIIDWEHSRKEGLPWLDLMYLIVYNRIMTGTKDFFSVYRETVMEMEFDGFELTLVSAYLEAIPLTPDIMPLLAYLFFIHHIGCRYRYNMDMEHDRYHILTTLGDIETRLDRHCH